MMRFQFAFVLSFFLTTPGSAFNVAGASVAKLDHTIQASTGHELASFENEGQPYQRKKKDSPLANLVLGILIWWLVPVCIWNNERIAIKQYKMQLKAERWAIHIDDPEIKPFDDMEGRICYMSGKSSVDETIADEAFPQVTRTNVIKLRREVEMFQWVEEKHEDTDSNGDVTRVWYTYSQSWRDSHQSVCHDDSKINPEFPLSGTRRQESYRVGYFIADGNGGTGPCAEAKHENVKLGSYYLGDYVIRELQNWKPTEDITPEQVVVNKRMVRGSTARFEGSAKKIERHWYFGDRTGNEIGNVRVRFEELQCGPTTLCGVLAKTEKGFTTVPILRADAAGAGDSFWAELGGGAAGCCLRVRELHYEEEDDDDFKERLKDWPIELTKKEMKSFHRAKTAKEVTEYNPEADIEDLCCVGPFGGAVIKLMHYIGLEEEFLGVAEKDMELRALMSKENSDAASRHNAARVGGCICLCCGSLLIISPITALLNYNWLVAALGGAFLSAVISCLAMLCSLGCCLCIMSCAWLVYRPILAVFGFLVCFLCFLGMYWLLNESYEHTQETGAAAFLALRQVRQAVHLG